MIKLLLLPFFGRFLESVSGFKGLDAADSALGGQTGLFPEISSFVYFSTLLRRRALDDVGAVAPFSTRRLYLILYRITLGDMLPWTCGEGPVVLYYSLVGP